MKRHHLFAISSLALLDSPYSGSSKVALTSQASRDSTSGSHRSTKDAQAHPAEVFRLACGLRARVQGSEVVLTNGTGHVVARNRHLIRQQDEDRFCPSEGFERIVSKGDYFTIEQQTCGGWFYIKEYLTFRYEKASGKIVLHKYGRAYTDRRNPNKIIPAELYTAKQLGQPAFTEVTKTSLDAVE